MREVNFSLPNVNKASVSITPALYDRRALDCTSTLPLINSLNHLAFLTTSSARIRDILTVDGGIERLICILKEGRSKDMLEMWKWNLAFQCVVNIGVRGTEDVRRRVVEADMVPVVATMLDNYIKVLDKCRDKQQEVDRHGCVASALTGGTLQSRQSRTFDSTASSVTAASASSAASSSTSSSASSALNPPLLSSFFSPAPPQGVRAMRRNNPPRNIDVPASITQTQIVSSDDMAATAEASRLSDQTSSHRRHESLQTSPPISARQSLPHFGIALSYRGSDAGSDTSLAERVPPALASPLPASPTTPLPVPPLNAPTNPVQRLRRPSIRHQESGGPSDVVVEAVVSDTENTDILEEAVVQNRMDIEEFAMDDADDLMEPTRLDVTGLTAAEAADAAAINAGIHVANLGDVGSPGGLGGDASSLPGVAGGSTPRYSLERHLIPTPQVIAAMPREEDVLMSLQLLAYISKYCNLRSYFYNCHLVPRLKIGNELNLLDSNMELPESTKPVTLDEDELEDENLLPDDFNIFPLIEKFTMLKYHSVDMNYWSSVVMRNLCRKDESKGGIRQCANYQCAKWESFPRQFAKCRRCRRTKYCSKECQKSAWGYHRHWCNVPATAPASSSVA